MNMAQQLADGGFIIAGSTAWGYDEAVLLRTDSLGNEVWSRNIRAGEQIGQDMFGEIYPVAGGYQVFGTAGSNGHGGFDAWFLRTDTAGRELYQRFYGGPSDDGLSGYPCPDGSWILCGQTFSYGAGYSHMWVVKVDSGGNELWSRTFGSPDSDYTAAGMAQPTADGGYVVVGETNMPVTGLDVYLLKFDADGSTAIANTRSRGLPRVDAEPRIEVASVGTGLRAIRYYVPRQGPIALTLFDVIGRKRATIVSADMAAGWHEAAMPAGLTGGSYVLKLEAAQTCACVKVVLLAPGKARW